MNQDAQRILNATLQEALPGAAVGQALEQISFNPDGRLLVVAAGKAAWEMARAAVERLDRPIDAGVVVTKYSHARGPLDCLEIFEAGHPVPDENSYRATARALEVVSGLTERDSVLFLLSGGGSALFEQPLIPAEEMADVTRQLLACGANIVEMNTLRKRLSAVKGGRFAQRCAPAHVYTVVLSDIIGDPLDMIASGPAYPDASTCGQAKEIVARYGLRLSERAQALIAQETPKALENVTTFVTGSVKQLCRTAERVCRELGYEPVTLTASLSCEAREAGAFLAAIARDHQSDGKALAYLAGGETVVHLTGKGLGGRNQEIALGAAEGIAGCKDTCVFSFGSDGSDGPTDAAGGYVDGDTLRKLAEAGYDLHKVLADNDAYHALKAVDGLIVTGPTGTNVNDLSVVLIKR
ncbi:MAG: glycerate kinase [Clostridiales bacterium]|nr:glycerate kinase [Clostridiales bacterium]MDO4349641.1 glycerate kinase [Eubacteriales bacterium]MDY4009823.1 glycerate kinase [Candidatus Limiplasma sp.]